MNQRLPVFRCWWASACCPFHEGFSALGLGVVKLPNLGACLIQTSKFTLFNGRAISALPYPYNLIPCTLQPNSRFNRVPLKLHQFSDSLLRQFKQLIHLFAREG